MITAFIAHLEAELIVTGGFKTVAHAWEVEPFDLPENVDLPAALSFIAEETSDESNADNLVKQRNTRQVWVYTICPFSDLEAMRERVFNAALGWQYTDSWAAMEHSRGQVRKISGDKIWWLDIFSTWHTVSQQ